VTVYMKWKDLEDPRFRRFYIGLWIVVVVVVGLLLTHLIPTGTIEDCVVESAEDADAFVQIESSCGSFISYSGSAVNLDDGVAYDFHLKGVFVRYVDTWDRSGG
jgi:hypothetical protein